MMTGDLPPSSSVTGVRLLAGGLRDDAPDAGRAGEDEMIERQLREGLGDAILDAGDDKLRRRERARDQLSQQFGEAWRQLAGLDHDEVAGGNRADRRRQGQLQRVIPGRDDADDAERLRDQAIAGRPELQRGGDAPRRHPAGKLLHRVLDLGEQEQRLGDRGLDAGAMAEIGGDRRDEARLVGREQVAQPLQPRAPDREIGRSSAARQRDHGVEGIVERGQRGTFQGLVHRRLLGSAKGKAIGMMGQARALWNRRQGR